MNNCLRIPIALLVLGAAPAMAATATGNLSVTATVVATCSVATTPVAFGVINSATTNAATGTVAVSCTNGTGYSIALGDGGYFSSGRRMQSSTTTYEYLPFELYQEVGHSTLWGDGSHGSVMGSLTGNGGTQSYNIYGLIPANQYSKADSYAATVQVTVTYP